MQKLIVTGGKRLEGELVLQGSKNSALPIMAAALLAEGECVLKTVPVLRMFTPHRGFLDVWAAKAASRTTRWL